MIVRVKDILHDGNSISFHLPPPIDSGDYHVGFTGVGSPFRVDLFLSLPAPENFLDEPAGKVFVSGIIKGEHEVICNRCGIMVSRKVDISVDRDYLPSLSDSFSGGDRQLSVEELELGFYSEGVIDLSVMVYEELSLDMPVIFICRDDCMGTCTLCGENMNLKECTCKASVKSLNLIKGLEKI